jgi:hypothetical protein
MSAEQEQQSFVEGQKTRKRRQKKEYSSSDSEDASITNPDHEESGNKIEVDESEYQKFCRWRKIREQRRGIGCPLFRNMFDGEPPEPTEEEIEQPQNIRMRRRRRLFREPFDGDSFGRWAPPPPQCDYEGRWARGPRYMRDLPYPCGRCQCPWRRN